MDEIWKDVPGFEGRYSVSNKGKVKSLNYGNTGKSRNLKPNLKKDGYYDVALADSGKYRYMRVHRLVALAFIPNPNRKTVINHINGVKTDNRVANLEWCTPR